MPDHIPGWENTAAYREMGLTQEQGDRLTEAFAAVARQQRSMPAHRIAYYLVAIQIALFLIGLMLWAEINSYGARWLNLAIALGAVYTGFAAHHRLWRGGP